MNNSKVLVLGADGMLGKMLSLYLDSNKELEITVTSRKSTSFIEKNFNGSYLKYDALLNDVDDLISKKDKILKWISKYGSKEEKKLFERFITFIDPVYYANQFEVKDKETAFFLSSFLGFRNGGEVLLKNANSLENRVLYFSNFVYQNGVTITFRKNSSTPKTREIFS